LHARQLDWVLDALDASEADAPELASAEPVARLLQPAE
jgi:hypothetical protein